jgi:excisionase family DNA binding protein
MRAVEDGKLAAYRVGSQRRVKVCDVETWIDGCRERRR